MKKRKFKISTILLILFAIIQVFPLIWMIDFSLCKGTDLFAKGILYWPEEIQWVNYGRVLFDSNYFRYLLNSILVNGTTILCVIVIAIMAAYACVKMNWKLKGFMSMIFLMGMMIPIHATLLPNFIIYSKIHITDTFWALLIPYVAFTFPQAFFLTSTFMESVPRELEEAAVIDGCGVYRTLLVVVLPVMKASIATVAVMTFLSTWNEFIMAMTFLSKPTWKTLPFLVLEFTGQYSSDYALQFATMALSSLPALIVYALMNKHITKGATMGALKG